MCRNFSDVWTGISEQELKNARNTKDKHNKKQCCMQESKLQRDSGDFIGIFFGGRAIRTVEPSPSPVKSACTI